MQLSIPMLGSAFEGRIVSVVAKDGGGEHHAGDNTECRHIETSWSRSEVQPKGHLLIGRALRKE